MGQVDLEELTLLFFKYAAELEIAQRSRKKTKTCWKHLSRQVQSNWYFIGRNFMRTLSPGLLIWKDMQRNELEDTASWRTGKIEHSYKVSTPRLDDRQFKNEELATEGD